MHIIGKRGFARSIFLSETWTTCLLVCIEWRAEQKPLVTQKWSRLANARTKVIKVSLIATREPRNVNKYVGALTVHFQTALLSYVVIDAMAKLLYQTIIPDSSLLHNLPTSYTFHKINSQI